MLKRYIKDCVHRESAVYSPWLLKPAVAAHYDLPVEMSEEVRQRVAGYKERQMDKRKRERDNRMGIGSGHGAGSVEEREEEEEVEEKPKGKKAKIDKDKGKDVKVEREEVKKKLVKFPAEGEYLTAT
jgi:bromodomain adjacent to zinc finger domain protein 1A